jgi:hypothetical protein
MAVLREMDTGVYVSQKTATMAILVRVIAAIQLRGVITPPLKTSARWLMTHVGLGTASEVTVSKRMIAVMMATLARVITVTSSLVATICRYAAPSAVTMITYAPWTVVAVPNAYTFRSRVTTDYIATVPRFVIQPAVADPAFRPAKATCGSRGLAMKLRALARRSRHVRFFLWWTSTAWELYSSIVGPVASR